LANGAGFRVPSRRGSQVRILAAAPSDRRLRGKRPIESGERRKGAFKEDDGRESEIPAVAAIT